MATTEPTKAMVRAKWVVVTFYDFGLGMEATRTAFWKILQIHGKSLHDSSKGNFCLQSLPLED